MSEGDDKIDWTGMIATKVRKFKEPCSDDKMMVLMSVKVTSNEQTEGDPFNAIQKQSERKDVNNKGRVIVVHS